MFIAIFIYFICVYHCLNLVLHPKAPACVCPCLLLMLFDIYLIDFFSFQNFCLCHFFSVSIFLLNFSSYSKTFSLRSWIFQPLWYHSCRCLKLSLRDSFPGLKLNSLSVYLSCLSGPWNLLKIGLWNSGLFLWHFCFLIRRQLWSCEFVDWSDGELCFPCVFSFLCFALLLGCICSLHSFPLFPHWLVFLSFMWILLVPCLHLDLCSPGEPTSVTT